MPHALIDYSANAASAQELTGAVHAAMAGSGLFQAKDIKTRATPAAHFMVGDKGPQGSFVHVGVYLLEGRTPEQKALLSQGILAALSPKTSGVNSVTVDIRDMDKNAYRKAEA